MFLFWGFTFILVVLSEISPLWSKLLCQVFQQSDLQDTLSAHNSVIDFSARPCCVLCCVYLKGKAKYLKGSPYPDFRGSLSMQHSFVYYPAPQIPDNSAASSAQQECSILRFFFPVVLDQNVPADRRPSHSSVCFTLLRSHTPWSACSASQDGCFVYFAQFYCLCWKS